MRHFSLLLKQNLPVRPQVSNTTRCWWLRNGAGDHMGFVLFESTLQNWTHSTSWYVKWYVQGRILKRAKGIRKLSSVKVIQII